MATQVVGAEFRRFYQDPAYWPDGAFHDDVVFKVNGEVQEFGLDLDNLADTDIVTIDGGLVISDHLTGREPSVETYFKRWKKQQSTVSFLVECDQAKLDAVKAAIKAAGGRLG